MCGVLPCHGNDATCVLSSCGCIQLCLLVSTRHLAGLNQYGLMRSENVGMIECQGHHYGFIVDLVLPMRTMEIFEEAALTNHVCV